MRIGFDGKRAFYNYTGLGNYSRDLLRSLLQHSNNNEYFIYTPGIPSNPRSQFLTDGKFTIKTPESSIYKVFKSYWRSVKITKQAQKDQLDIYHGLSHELPYGIEDTDIKTIVTIHDLIYRKFPEFYSSIDRKIYDNKVLYACKVADAIIATSEQTKKDIIEFTGTNPERIKVIYQSCAEQFRIKLSTEEISSIRNKHQLPERYILNVGTIEERKNAMALIESAAFFDAPVPIVFVGKQTRYTEKVQRLAESLNILDRVHFISNLPFEDLPAVYQGAMMFVYPSLYEGFGIPLLEALESNIPIITNKNGCFKEVAGPDSVYVDVEDPKTIAEAVNMVLTDDKLRLRMIESGKKHATQFSYEAFGKKSMNLYKSLHG